MSWIRSPSNDPDEAPTRDLGPKGSAAPRPELLAQIAEYKPDLLAPSERPALMPGSLVAERYKVLEKLASGGMGEVYRAEHVELGRVFALKVMLPDLSQDPNFVERFRREAVASSKIGHPNIVDITDFGKTASGAFFFAMELLEGKTLQELSSELGPIPVERVLHLAAQMCRALSAAHALGIVHRDPKPENVMVLQRPGMPDLVKILDFGIAKVTAPESAGLKTKIGVVV